MCFWRVFLSCLRLGVIHVETLCLRGCFRHVVVTVNLDTERANLPVNSTLKPLSKKSVVFLRVHS